MKVRISNFELKRIYEGRTFELADGKRLNNFFELSEEIQFSPYLTHVMIKRGIIRCIEKEEVRKDEIESSCVDGSD